MSDRRWPWQEMCICFSESWPSERSFAHPSSSSATAVIWCFQGIEYYGECVLKCLWTGHISVINCQKLISYIYMYAPYMKRSSLSQQFIPSWTAAQSWCTILPNQRTHPVQVFTCITLCSVFLSSIHIKKEQKQNKKPMNPQGQSVLIMTGNTNAFYT